MKTFTIDEHVHYLIFNVLHWMQLKYLSNGILQNQ